jgi:hypothetical protein
MNATKNIFEPLVFFGQADIVLDIQVRACGFSATLIGWDGGSA